MKTKPKKIVTGLNGQMHKTNKQTRAVTPALVGFDSVKDFAETAFSPASGKFLFMVSMLGGLSSFITNYIYNDAQAVYLLFALIGLDALTGIVNALKKNTFSSKRLPRILGVTISYTLILGLSWNLSKYNAALDFLPGMIYFGFSSVLFVSIIENLNELGLIPKALAEKILEKIKGKK
jgi:phage-related holin